MLSEFDSNLNEIIDIKELADLMDAVDSEEDEQVIVKPIYVKNWFIKPIKSVFNQEWVRVEGVMVENDTILVTTGEICRVLSQNSIQDIHDQIYTLVGGMDLIANTLSGKIYP